MVCFAFTNILYVNNKWFNAYNVKTNNGTFSLMVVLDDISNYGQEAFIFVSVTPENVIGLYYCLLI